MQRERGGEKSADRRGLLRSERGGKGRRAERATPLGRARVAGEGRNAGPSRPKARDERGVELGQGLGGWARFNEGNKDKRKTLLYFSEL